MRGRVKEISEEYENPGITPACAGKSRPKRPTEAAAGRDHPRVCGEERVDFRKYGCPVGSPPRVRGRALGDNNRAWIGRITPACAGKSFVLLGNPVQHEDHPRVCGEEGV